MPVCDNRTKLYYDGNWQWSSKDQGDKNAFAVGYIRLSYLLFCGLSSSCSA